LFAAVRLPVYFGMWRQQVKQFKQPVNARISGQRDGYGHIRLTEPFQRSNGHHQIKQTAPQGPTAVRPCAGRPFDPMSVRVDRQEAPKEMDGRQESWNQRLTDLQG